MSTKSTLAHGDDFHFYAELFDNERVYLDLTDPVIEVFAETGKKPCIRVGIPYAVWDKIREITVQKAAYKTYDGKPKDAVSPIAKGEK